MRKITKLMAVCLSSLFCIGVLVGCASTGDQKSPQKQSAATKKVKLGIIQHTDNQSFTQMREAMLKQLKKLGYDDSKLEVDYKNAQGDMSNLNTICQTMISEKEDVIVPVVTPATQALVNAGGNTPIIFMSVTNPVGAKIMKDLKKPVNNITGTSNAVPVNKIFELGKKLTPKVKTYGIIYDASEVNSVSTVNDAKKYLSANGYQYKEAVVANASEVQQATQSLIDKVDAIFVPLDSVVNSAMSQVADITKKAKVPVYTAADTMVVNGGFATVGVSYEKIGIMTANMIDKYLKGTPISKLPCETLDNFATVINQKTAEAIGVTVPEDILKQALVINK